MQSNDWADDGPKVEKVASARTFKRPHDDGCQSMWLLPIKMFFKQLVVPDSGKNKNHERLEYSESELAWKKRVKVAWHETIKKLSQAACVYQELFKDLALVFSSKKDAIHIMA
jgi:hypothetical protein